MSSTITTSRIRIGFVIDTLMVPAGGTEQQLLVLLEKLDRSRFEPHVFCLNASDWLREGKLTTPWTDLDIHLSFRPALPLRLARFSRLLREQRFDIVQAHFRDSNVVGVLAASWAGVPVIISTRRGVPYWQSRIGLWFLRELNRRVSCFVANSNATKAHYVRAEGLHSDDVAVIHNGLDPSRFRGLGSEQIRHLRHSIGIADGAVVIGIVANLRPVKGIGDLVLAARIVVARFPHARFIVIGRGPEAGALLESIEELGLKDHVQLLGARADVPMLLQSCDIGVLSSHFESFSNSILEYRAAGLPVVVTDVGGAREVVEDGLDGYVVPARSPEILADRLIRLLAHPGGPRSWVEGRGFPERFHTTSMVAAHHELYERCLHDARLARRVSKE